MDPYKVLGISENASIQEIKAAYKALIKKYHPDQYNNAPEELVKLASDKTAEINQAYELLKDGNYQKEEDYCYDSPADYSYEDLYRENDNKKIKLKKRPFYLKVIFFFIKIFICFLLEVISIIFSVLYFATQMILSIPFLGWIPYLCIIVGIKGLYDYITMGVYTNIYEFTAPILSLVLGMAIICVPGFIAVIHELLNNLIKTVISF